MTSHNNCTSGVGSPVVTRAGRDKTTDANCDNSSNDANKHQCANHYTGNLSSSQGVSCDIT